MLSGCAVIKRTPKAEKNIEALFTHHPPLKNPAKIRYRVYGNGLSLSGTLHIEKKDSILKVRTSTIFTGSKNIRININNTGYPILDLAIKYAYSTAPFPEFNLIGKKENRIFLFTKGTDTIEVIPDGKTVRLIRNRKDYIQFFYRTEYHIKSVKGQFSGFEFEGKIIE